MRKTLFIFGGFLALAILVAGGLSTSDAQAPPREMVWEGCELYETVVTPAVFDPANGPFDELYVNPHGFKDGYALISDAAPGTEGFNGGRWHKNVLKSDVPMDKYSDACSVDDLDPNDFVSTDEYFECPMLPRRGNR
jgi:hypothetical protein